MSSESDSELVGVLEDIRRWVRLIGIQESKSVLHDAVRDSDDKKRQALKIIYYMTDGSTANSEIAEHIDYSSEFVRIRRKEWIKVGLLEKNGRIGYNKLVSLNQAGIEEPELPGPEYSSEQDEDETEETKQ